MQIRDEKITNARLAKHAREQAECSFSPKVCVKSSEIASRLSRGKLPYNSLYKDSFDREDRRKKHQKARQASSSPPERTLDAADIDRLVNTRQACEEQLFYKRRHLSELKNPETGQDYFKPVVGRAPFTPRNPNGLPIGSYLTTQPVAKPIVKESQSSKFPIPQSEKLLLKVKSTRYHELFTQLNPDEQGVIRASSIRQEAVDADALKVMRPFLEELEELNETLDFYEFSEAMDNLVDILTPPEKARLFKLQKQAAPATVYPHKPQINRTSTPRQGSLSSPKVKPDLARQPTLSPKQLVWSM
jgi:hypothetical protein